MDGDRIIGADMFVHISEHLNIHIAGQQLVGHYSSTADSGTYGTIACPTRLFHHMRGYNEEFLPCGYQDAELLQRAVAAGAKIVKVSEARTVGCSLPNPEDGSWKDQSKVKNWNVDMRDLPGHTKLLKFGHQDQLNRTLAYRRIQEYGPVKRNVKPPWKPIEVQPLGPRRPAWLAPPLPAEAPPHCQRRRRK